MRIGIGYDVHKLIEGRELILGGINIPHEKGLLGHSDADVLIHAIMDAIIGALGKGDIGLHFPDNDEKYKNISSMVLLSNIVRLMEDNNYFIVNLDSIIIAEKPKIRPFIEAIELNLSSILKIDISQINVKATTTEKLGFIGREEGIAAECVVILDNK